MLEHFSDGIKGEIVCMVYAEEDTEIADIKDKIEVLKSKGYKDKDVAVILSSLFKYNKNDVYKRSLEM